jgi:hypothetical protein
MAATASDTKTITVHRTYYRDEDVHDGDIPRDNVWTVVYDCGDWEPLAETAADFLNGEGLTQPSATDWGPRVWYSHPDGATTGYRCEPTAHLDGFTDEESADIFARITGPAHTAAGTADTAGQVNRR